MNSQKDQPSFAEPVAESDEEPGAEIDSTYYIESDDMGESSFQFFVAHHLVELIQFYLESEGRQAFVSGNQFMHLEKGNEAANIAPDIYVLLDETLDENDVRSWKLWEHDGKGPCLAVEVVSDDPKMAAKDYDPEMLEKYRRMGVKELFRYDPYGVGRRLGGQRRRVLTHWVRAETGALIEQALSHPFRAQSAQFGFWLVHLSPRALRLGVGPEGRVLFQSRQETFARRAEEEARRAEEEARRANVAERLLAEARAEIERLKGTR